jgi:hypothetical protein
MGANQLLSSSMASSSPMASRSTTLKTAPPDQAASPRFSHSSA